MKNILQNQKVKTIIFSSCLIIFGLLFCLLPEKSLDVLELILSVFLIVYGFICLLGFAFAPVALRDSFLLIESIVMLAVGVLMDFVPSLFVILIGVIILIGGLRVAVNSINMKLLMRRDWWADLCLGSVFAALGIIVIVLSSTKVATTIISILLGITLILDGICYLVLLFVLKREAKKIDEELKKKFVEINDFSVTDKQD